MRLDVVVVLLCLSLISPNISTGTKLLRSATPTESALGKSINGPGTPPSEAEMEGLGEPEKADDASGPGFGFYPATLSERREAAEAPTDPHVEDARENGQPFQPFIPHGIDLGATSLLTGSDFMQN